MKDKLIVLCPNMLKAKDTITSIVEDGAYTGTINQIGIKLTNGTSIIFVAEGDTKAFYGHNYKICSLERFKEILNKNRKDHERSDDDGTI